MPVLSRNDLRTLVMASGGQHVRAALLTNARADTSDDTEDTCCGLEAVTELLLDLGHVRTLAWLLKQKGPRKFFPFTDLVHKLCKASLTEFQLNKICMVFVEAAGARAFYKPGHGVLPIVFALVQSRETTLHDVAAVVRGLPAPEVERSVDEHGRSLEAVANARKPLPAYAVLGALRRT